MSGPWFMPTDEITCTFGNIDTPCKFISHDSCVTVTPSIPEASIVQLTVTVQRSDRVLSGSVSFRYGEFISGQRLPHGANNKLFCFTIF